MGVIEDFKPWIDKYGLVTDNLERRETGNGNRFTGEYVCILAMHGLLKGAELSRLKTVFKNNELGIGYLLRTPHKIDDKTSPEEYLGALVSSSLMKTDYCSRFLIRGRASQWCFNHIKPGDPANGWPLLIRAQHFIAVAQYAVGEKVPLWRRLFTCAVFLLASRSKKRDEGAWVQSWMLYQGLKGRCVFIDIGYKVFERQLRRTFPGGVGDSHYRLWRVWKHPTPKHLEGVFK